MGFKESGSTAKNCRYEVAMKVFRFSTGSISLYVIDFFLTGKSLEKIFEGYPDTGILSVVDSEPAFLLTHTEDLPVVFVRNNFFCITSSVADPDPQDPYLCFWAIRIRVRGTDPIRVRKADTMLPFSLQEERR
jgi:hypothetical protein